MAGGQARRFGGKPKGLATVGQRTILDRVVETLSLALQTPPILIANDPAASLWRPDLRTVSDRIPDGGTIAGLLTAVLEAPAPVVCLAWDMPFVSVDLVRELAAGLSRADAVVPASGGRRGMEPLCAGYGPACAPAIERCIERGDLRAVAFHDAVRTTILPASTVERYGDPARQFFNVNTPEDLIEAECMWRQLG